MSAPAERSPTRALQYGFAAHLRDPAHAPAPAGVEDHRLAVYRELFFNNVESLLAGNFPVIRTLYDDAGWNALVRGFYAEHQSHTPLFTEIAREFIRYLELRAAEGRGDPPFLVELAHYEWSELALTLDEHEIADVAHDPGGDPLTGVPAVSPLAWLLAYRFAVHRIRPDFRPHAAPDRPTLILLVRDRADTVTFLTVEPLTALLFQRLQDNSTLPGLECLDGTLVALGRHGDQPLRETGIAMLSELKRRDAILGTRI